MDNAMRILAEEAARLVLQDYCEAHPGWLGDKTPIDALVAVLGLHVETFHPDDYAKGTYGFIDPDEHEDLIWLCRDLPESFRRFTLAHELGHIILHCQGGRRLRELVQRSPKMSELIALQDMQEVRVGLPELSRNDPCNERDVQEDMTALLDEEGFQDTLGIGHSYDPRSQREQAANVFAAELLLPLERVRTLYLVERVPAAALANLFGVSNTALLTRLAGLMRPPTSQEQMLEAALQERQPVPPPVAKPYDEFQRAAITAQTPALIVAGPGSGKTSTLIGRVVAMIQEQGIEPQHILALTFSRKATLEMEERLQKALVGQVKMLPKVSTFHAFCADILRQHGTLVGLRSDFTLLDEAEGYFLLRQAANEMRLQHYQKLQAPAYYFPDMLKAISRAKDELVSSAQYAQLAQAMLEQAQNEEVVEKAEKALEIAHVYALYEDALRRRSDSDFGGLLMLTLRLFQEHPEILREQQEKYQHILVDEFQDVNRASGVLLRELAGTERRVWVVGDANQAIYGFRGASPANISQFEHDFPGAVVLPLSRNYRSRPDLVALAEAFRCVQLELGQEPGKNQPTRLTNAETYVTLAKASDELSEINGIIQHMQMKRAEGCAFKDMVVLCRTRAQVQKISRALADAGLPVVEQGGMLEQEHIKDVLSIILLLTDTSGMGLLRAAHQREHSLSQHDIEAILLAAREPGLNPRALVLAGEAPATMSEAGRQGLLRLSEILQSLQRTTDAWSLLAQYLLIETPLIRDLLSGSQGKEQRLLLADYERLLQVARHFDQQQRARRQQQEREAEAQGLAKPQPPLFEEWTKGFLEYLSLLVLLRQDGGSRQSSEEEEGAEADIIRVMTVHASKGLEFPIVYMPWLVQRRFPMQARANAVSTPSGMLPEESEGSEAHESGEACLFYVGVTRARDQLILSYSERYGKVKYKRSPYLDALEAGIAEERIMKLQWESKTTQAKQGIENVQEADQAGMNEEFIKAMKSPTLSASAIETYQNCPRKYAYSNIYHFSGEADGYQLFWQATQKTVEELRKQLHEPVEPEQLAKQFPTQEQVQELYAQQWREVGGPDMPFAPMYERHGQEVVEALRRKFTAQAEVNWQVREPFNVDLGGKAVRVTVDRVEVANQAATPARFVRTRFGRRKEKPAADLRELFYTLVYRQLHPGQEVELHSHNMSTGEVVPIKMTEKKEQSLRESAEKAIEGIEQDRYPAQPAEPYRCPSCPFFLICPS